MRVDFVLTTSRQRNRLLRARDRWFESISLQRRVLCEPNADEGARDRARLASGLENALGVRRSSMYSALSRPQPLPWQTPRRSRWSAPSLGIAARGRGLPSTQPIPTRDAT